MECKHGFDIIDIGPSCPECDREQTVTRERERIIQALKKLPGSNGRRAEQIIRALPLEQK